MGDSGPGVPRSASLLRDGEEDAVAVEGAEDAEEMVHVVHRHPVEQHEVLIGVASRGGFQDAVTIATLSRTRRLAQPGRVYPCFSGMPKGTGIPVNRARDVPT